MSVTQRLGREIDVVEIPEGYNDEQVKTTFTMTKDIRDKYVGTRLFWDLGILDEIADKTFS